MIKSTSPNSPPPQWVRDPDTGQFQRTYTFMDFVRLNRLKDIPLQRNERAAINKVFIPLNTWTMTAGAPATYTAVLDKESVIRFENAVKKAIRLYKNKTQ